jgi:hypothetical protein
MYKAHDLIPDIETIAIGGRGNVDVVSISFPFVREDSTMDLTLWFVFSIAILLNHVVIQWVLSGGCSQSIIPCFFHAVLQLIHVKLHSLILGILEGVIHIDRVHRLHNW